MTIGELLTMGTMMRETGLAHSTLRYHMRRGAIPHQVLSNGTRVVRRVDFDAWKAIPRRPRGPKKKERRQ